MTNTKFKFGEALVDEVYVIEKDGEETVYVAYYREVFVDDVNVGNLFWSNEIGICKPYIREDIIRFFAE